MSNHIYYLSSFILTLVTLCALIAPKLPFVQADSFLKMQLQKMKVTPDIIDIPDWVPTIKFELHNNIVKPGDQVPVKNLKDLTQSKIHWEVSNFDARHTLLLLDLDRRSSPANTNNTQNIFNQFTSLNIPGNVFAAGQTITAYDQPQVPCQPSSKHRILMLAFHQQQNIDISDVAYISALSGNQMQHKRENFKLNEFVNRHRLDLVAANVFWALGESGGVCSGSASIQSVSSILIAMVTALAAVCQLAGGRRSLIVS